MAKDLRQFLQELEQRAPDFVVRIAREVDAKWELSAVQKKLEREGRLPVILFENVKGHDIPVVVNDDIDIFDDGQVLWAVMARTQPDHF